MTALEHLRKLIEASTEKIKAARVKEEQARKVCFLRMNRLCADEYIASFATTVVSDVLYSYSMRTFIPYFLLLLFS